jgi:hypothetical protein
LTRPAFTGAQKLDLAVDARKFGMGLCLGPRKFCTVQEASCIVIDQAIQPELLRCTLAKKLLHLVAARLVIP